MKKHKGKKKAFLAVLLSAAVICQTFPAYSLAAQGPDGICPHHTEHTEECGYQEAAACQFVCEECQNIAAESERLAAESEQAAQESQQKIDNVQNLIDALPEADSITAENLEDVKAQLAAIEEAKAELDETQQSALKLEKYNAAVERIAALEAEPQKAPADTQEAGTSDVQTDNSVAKVGTTYYDSLADALNNASNQTCDILKNTSLYGKYEFPSWKNNPVTINLNGHTISGSCTLFLGGVSRCSYLNGPGIISGNIEIENAELRAPLTVNGNITESGVTDFAVNGQGTLQVNGDIADFSLPSKIGDGVTIICTGTCYETDIKAWKGQEEKPQNLKINYYTEFLDNTTPDMEYSSDGGSTWSSCDDDRTLLVSMGWYGDSEKTVLVRTKGTDTMAPSDPVTIDIPARPKLTQSWKEITANKLVIQVEDVPADAEIKYQLYDYATETLHDWQYSNEFLNLKAGNQYDVYVNIGKTENSFSDSQYYRVKTADAQYTLSIPASLEAGGAEAAVSVDATQTFDLGYEGKVNVSIAENSNGYDGNVTMKRTGAENTLVSELNINGAKVTGGTIASFANKTDSVTIQASKPKITGGSIVPAGQYTGNVTFQINYQQ